MRLAVPLLAVLLSLAGGVSAQVLMRPPGQGAPALQRSQGQVPRPPGTTDPDGPYSLTLRVYVTPSDATRALPPGQGVHLLLTDAAGRRFGRAVFGDAFHREIPDASYDAVVNPNPNAPVGPRGRTGTGIALRRPAEGKYVLEVIGAETAQYEYVLQAWDRTGRQRWMHFGSGGTEPGAVDRFEVTYSMSLDPSVWIAEKPDDAYLSVHAWGETGQGQDVFTRLLLTDPRGRRLGDSAPAGTRHREIPRALYEEGGQTRDTMELEILAPLDGVHTLDVIGAYAGRYEFEIHYSAGQASHNAHVAGIPIVPGAVHRYKLECARGGKPLFRLSGGFGSGALLTFASPTGASTRVSPAQAMFPVVVFYGAAILPASFQATLNGVDVAGRFRPRPDGHEVVGLQLRPGRNELVLWVEGRAGGPERVTTRTTLEFDVR